MARINERKDIHDIVNPRRAEFAHVLREYQSGKMSEKRFRTYYNSLRSIVNRRLKSMVDLGMETEVADTAMSYNLMDTDMENIYFQAPTKTTDMETTYQNMLDYYESLWSTKRGYEESVKEIVEDFRNAGYDVNESDTDFIKFVATGQFRRIVKQYGNSDDVYEDINNMLEAGYTYEDITIAFEDFITGANSAYDAALRKARRAKEARLARESINS